MSSMAEGIGLAALAAPSFSGRLWPTERDDENRRAVDHGLIEKGPAALASCHDVADVVEAVRAARMFGLAVSVRGGNNNVDPRATIHEGLMIDLSPMKRIHVDERARTARAEAGVLWREFNGETQVHGLATTGGIVGGAGIAGLTLGGGIGWLMPRYGLALDNLRAADLVLDDGRVVRAAADENPDLFWAIRGGGGNFGVAVSLEYTLHPVGPMITGGVVVHPLERGLGVLRFFRDTCASLPDEAMLVALLQTAADGSNAKMLGICGGHCGPVEDGRAVFRSLKTFGPPAIDLMGTMPYIALDSMLAPAFPTAARTYCRTLFLTEMSDDAIRTLIRAFARCPSPMSRIMIEHVHGAATRVPVTATACTTRCAGFNVVVASQWMGPGERERGVRWARETCASLAPYAARRHDGTCAEDNDADPVQIAYGPNLPRLRAIKARYDPDNLFRQHVNILPA
jgi:FAD/FMN-containing dehydrogenase